MNKFRSPLISKLLLFFILATSCSNIVEIEKDVIDSPFKTTEINDPSVSAKIGNWMNNQNSTSFKIKSSEVTFDMINLSKTTIENADEIVYVAKETSNPENGFNIGFVQKNNEITGAIIVKLSIVDNFKVIDYYDLSGQLLNSVKIDEANKSVEILYSYGPNNLGGRTLEECGERVATCIGKTYTDYGWFSVGVFVATLFSPAVGVGVVVLCTATECPKLGDD